MVVNVTFLNGRRIINKRTKTNDMETYKAIVTEETAASKGQIIANTKSPGLYNGMTKEQFTEAVEHISAYTISIIEM